VRPEDIYDEAPALLDLDDYAWPSNNTFKGSKLMGVLIGTVLSLLLIGVRAGLFK
jgi:hypothetical protein